MPGLVIDPRRGFPGTGPTPAPNTSLVLNPAVLTVPVVPSMFARPDCGPREMRNPDGSCSELVGIKGTLGRLGKVFGGK